jgi:glycosyltransferase involved in cell wall biosynthesis
MSQLSNQAPTEHIAFTIATRSYLAGALVWRKTLQDSNTRMRGLIYLVDEKPNNIPRICAESKSICPDYANDLESDLRSSESAEIPDNEGMQDRYDIIEYCTAVKPSIFLSLAAEFPGRILHYFDPDTAAFGDLSELRRFSEEHSFTLTPHMSTPTDDHFRLSQLAVLRAGVFNFGYVGWNPSFASGWPLVRWWQRRLNKDCRIALSEGVFVDQSWGVMFCSSPDTGIFHDSAHNAAYWNMHEREIGQKGSHFTCDGRQLQFYHFSGYNPHKPDKLSLHQDRHELRGLRGLRALCHWYADSLFAAGFEHWREVYGRQKENRAQPEDMSVAKPASMPRTSSVFAARKKADVRVAEAFGNPRAFLIRAGVSWWAEFFVALFVMSVVGDKAMRCGNLDGRRQLHHQLADVSLEENFAQKGLLELGFKYWWRRSLLLFTDAFGLRKQTDKTCSLKISVEETLTPAMQGSLPHSEAAETQHAIAVVGYITAETGLGESVRGIIRALDSIRKDADLYDIRGHYARTEELEFSARLRHRTPDRPWYGTCVAHINADQVPCSMSTHPVTLLTHADRRIGYWYWETENLPFGQNSAAHYFDEIWVATKFVHDSIVNSGVRVPVRVIPPSLSDLPSDLLGRGHFELPEDRPICLSVFDATSWLGRKNPLGVVKAMQRLYKTREERPLLVLKTTNLKDEDRKILLDFANPVDIVFINGYLSRQETLSLISAANCFVSLHRSEGLGLSLIDAMRLGTPLVSTDYSGPRDFATDENAFLVPWRYCAAQWEDGPYFGSTWAEPDIEVASDKIACALEIGEETEKKILLAKKKVEYHFSRERTGALLAEALA